MEKLDTTVTSMFKKLGIISAILPYYSFKVHEWKKFMCLLWKDTNALWVKSSKVFDKMHELTKWDYAAKLIELLKKCDIDKDAKVDENYVLSVYPFNRGKNFNQFFKMAEDFRLDWLDGLIFKNMKYWHYDLPVIQNFMGNVLPTTIKHVSFIEHRTSGTRWIQIEDWAQLLLPKVTETITIQNYYISPDGMTDIVNNSYNCKRVNLQKCWFTGKAKYGVSFDFKTDERHKMEILDLSGTTRVNKKLRMGLKVFNCFVNSIALKDIRNTLKKIVVTREYFNGVSKIQSLFDKKDIKIQIVTEI